MILIEVVQIVSLLLSLREVHMIDLVNSITILGKV